MLRGLIGDDAFWSGIRAYYATYRDANATTDDFRRAMEDASGRNLTWFFQQWLYGGGALIIDGDWRYDADRGVLDVRLDQAQDDGYTFRLPLEIAIYSDGEPRPHIERVEIAELHNEYEIKVDERPMRVVLDPGTWVLMETNFGPRR